MLAIKSLSVFNSASRNTVKIIKGRRGRKRKSATPEAEEATADRANCQGGADEQSASASESLSSADERNTSCGRWDCAWIMESPSGADVLAEDAEDDIPVRDGI